MEIDLDFFHKDLLTENDYSWLSDYLFKRVDNFFRFYSSMLKFLPEHYLKAIFERSIIPMFEKIVNSS